MKNISRAVVSKLLHIRKVQGRCFPNAEVAHGWIDALNWVLRIIIKQRK